MKKAMVLAVAGALLITGAVFGQRALAQHDGGHRHEMLAGLLDLSEAQKQATKTLMEQARSETKPIAEQLRKGHEEMRVAVTSGSPESELTAIAERQGARMGQLAAVHAKQMAKFYAQLTPEQQQKAAKLHDTMRDALRARMGWE